MFDSAVRPLAPPHPFELIERDDELEALEAVVGAALQGTGHPVVVRGIAGIGKSVLLDAFGALAADAGFEVLRARADPLEESFSFGVVLQLLEPAIASLPTGGVERIYAGPGGLARPLLETHGAAALDGGALFPTLHGLFALVADLAEHKPVALVVDDGQWSDVASLRFLHYLARRMAGHRIALVVGSRPVHDSPAGRILSGIGHHVLEPEPLSAGGLDLLLRTDDVGLDHEEIERWHRLTAGVPHHILELVRSGAGADPASGADLTMETVRVRLAALGEAARALAEVAAIAGDGSPWWRVLQMADLTDPDGSVRRELVDAHLLAAATEVRFVHAEVRDAVARSIDPARSGVLHLAAAAALTETAAPVEVIAHHLCLAPPTGSEGHARVLWQAARRSATAGARSQAATWLRRALQERPAPELKEEILGDLAVVAAAAGEPDWREALLEAAPTPTEPRRSAVLRLRLGRALTDRGSLADSVAVLQRGLGDYDGPADDELRLDLLAALAVANRMNVEHRIELDGEVRAALRAVGDRDSPAARALLAHLAYDRACSGGSAAEVRELARRAALDPRVADGELFGSGTFYLAQLAMHFADDAEGIEVTAERGLRVAEQRGHEPLLGLMASGLGKLRFSQGRIAEAVDRSELGVDLLRRTRGVVLAGAAGNLALCHLERDDADAAWAALELPGGIGAWKATANLNNWYFARALVRLHQGDHGGIDDLRVVLRRLDGQGVTNPATIPAAFALAEAMHPFDPDGARRTFEDAHGRAVAFGGPRTMAVAARTRATLDADRAVEHLRSACALVADSPWGLESLRARLALGRALVVAGDLVEAQTLLRQVLADADRCGAIRVADGARRSLHATGAKPRRTAVTGPAALTTTERQVADLARDGLTNRQIATRRFVSVKAVEFHLANAYRKLGIKNRAQLAIALPAGAPDDSLAARGT